MKPAEAKSSPAAAGAKRRLAAADAASVVADGSLIFLTGWPACGTVDFGAWLAEHRGYSHLDLDEDGPGDPELRAEWARLLPGSAPALIRALRTRGKRWVVTGERPADHLDNLTALREAGFAVWFLQPRMDSHSRQRWLARERERDPGMKPPAWEKLADAIRKKARELRPHFRDRCVETLAAEGLIDGEALAKAIGVPPPA